MQLEQARYQAQRAERQYNAVDPENRTVARELERRWNTALDAVRVVELQRDEAQQQRQRTQADPPDVRQYLELAHDLEHVWRADAADMTLKKRIVRTLVEQIWANVDNAQREIVLVVHWKGGVHTELRVRKRGTGEHRRKTAADVAEAVRVLARIMSDQQIAV